MWLLPIGAILSSCHGEQEGPLTPCLPNYMCLSFHYMLAFISGLSHPLCWTHHPWTTACQVSLNFTVSQSLLKLMSIQSVMPSNHLILCCPILLLPSIFPSIRVFASESALASGSQRIGASAPASALPVNFQGWFPLGLVGLISLQYKGLSRVFFSTTVQKHQFFSALSSLWSNSHIHTWLLEKP